MSEMYKKIEDLCSLKGVSVTAMCKEAGVKRSCLSELKSGRTKKLANDNAVAIANYFGVSTDYLFDSTNSLFNKAVNNVHKVVAQEFEFNVKDFIGAVEKVAECSSNLIPVLGSVRAGYPMYAEENIIDYEEISNEMARSGEYFALKVKGDSMIPRFADGDIVIVKKCETVENGEIAIVMVGQDEATIKKFYKTAVGVQLVATNPNFPAMTFTPEQVDSLPVTISGKVVELRAKF